jgi:SAM-dependent methyltransferase
VREWNARAYHELSEPQRAWGSAVIAGLELGAVERILDAGCGTGRVTTELSAAAPHARVIALDVSERMLAEAAPRLDALRPRVTLVRGDLAALPLRQAVDLVFSTATLHWVRDQPGLYSNLHGALRPGGRLAAQCGGAGNLALLLRRAGAILDRPAFQGYFHEWEEPWTFLDAGTAAGLARGAGFVDVHAELVAAPTPFADADTYRRFIGDVVLRVHVQRLPAALRDRLLDELVDQAQSSPEGLSLDYVRLNVRGRRR